jgi:hypothetical protein
LTHEVKNDIRFQIAAANALQEASEIMLINWFESRWCLFEWKRKKYWMLSAEFDRHTRQASNDNDSRFLVFKTIISFK